MSTSWSTKVPRIVAWFGVAFFLGIGLWAFLSPSSFFDQLAVFPPYNEHFLHDVGAFQIGFAAALLLGLLRWDGLATALGGAGVGTVVHTIAHVMDGDQGGKDTDPFGLGLLAIALLVGAWMLRPTTRTASRDAAGTRA
jgi:hypothetical protein